MSVTGCTHHEGDVVVLYASEYGGAWWCSVCGSVRWETQTDPMTEWQAPTGLLLPGWTCRVPTCRAFNGAAKEVLTECRHCGTPRRAA